MAGIESVETIIDNMTGDWASIERPPILGDVAAQVYSEAYREKIIVGYSALKAAINIELDEEEADGESFEVDVTAEQSVTWFEEDREIPEGRVAVKSFFRISRYTGPQNWIDHIRENFPETAVDSDPETFGMLFRAAADTTTYTGDPALLRLSPATYSGYDGPPTLLVGQRLYGVPYAEVPDQSICLGSDEVTASRPAGFAGDPLDAEPPRLPRWNGNTLIPGVELDQPYDVSTGVEETYHQEVYINGAALGPVEKIIPRFRG